VLVDPGKKTSIGGIKVMRALVVDPAAPAGLRLGEAPDPVPGPGQVLVDVRHTSLNYGEAASAANQEPGTVLGWDASGIVAEPAADGTGPAAGTAVVSFGAAGGWAQRRAVSVGELAVVPDTVDLGRAAALPVAGVTALRALRAAGSLLGRRVLVTGAAGGVGAFAVQLAAIGGAQVIASVGSRSRGEGLTELGARQVVVGLDTVSEPVDVVIENVGGHHLVRAFELLAPGGSLQSIGGTSGEPSAFPPYATVGPPKSLNAFTAGDLFGSDLAYLLALLAAGKLRAEVGWQGPWQDAPKAVAALLSRQIRGKAILDVEPWSGS
jgi:NADPH2:quinone reductase